MTDQTRFAFLCRVSTEQQGHGEGRNHHQRKIVIASAFVAPPAGFDRSRAPIVTATMKSSSPNVFQHQTRVREHPALR